MLLFESPPLSLSTLLDDVHTGKLQLPDFQRLWKWDDERIVSLLATVIMGYPLGVIMTLTTGGPGTRFKPRPLSGVHLLDRVEPSELLLDGQQRMTSLYQALRSRAPVETEDAYRNKVSRWYYIDIAEAINDFGSEVIASVPADRKYRLPGSRKEIVDLTTEEAECAAGYFPLRLALDSEAVNNWQRVYVTADPSRWDAWGTFQSKVLKNIADYRLPVIRLAKETPKEAVCIVFEKVNQGGVTLNVFELLTAIYAGDRGYYDAHGDDFHLPGRWKQVQDELGKHPVFVDTLKDTDFLQAVCLVSTHHRRRGRRSVHPFPQPAASCKRGDILDLPLEEYITWSPEIVSALHWTADFLTRQGVYGASDLPYRAQVTSLAAIRTVLGAEADAEEAEAKITQWYWCGVLGEQYGGSPDTRLPRDLEQVVAWVRGGRPPTSVTEASFSRARLNTMSSRNSAAYKGVLALLIRRGCIDWTYARDAIDPTVFEDQQVDVVLVFPKAWCDKHGVPPQLRDSIVNKTPLTNRTRRIIASQAPSAYLPQLEAEAGLPANWMDDIVGTHLIDAKCLRSTDFSAFYNARAAALLKLIGEAMSGTADTASDEANS